MKKTTVSIGLYLTAIHEAAHAVTAMYLRVPVHAISLGPIGENCDVAGHISIPPLRRIAHIVVIRNNRFRFRTRKEAKDYLRRLFQRKARKRIVIYLAGLAAEVNFLQDLNGGVSAVQEEALRESCKSDEQEVIELAKDYKLENSLSALRSRAMKIVSIPFMQRAIKDVADDLLLRKSLEPRRARLIYQIIRRHFPRFFVFGKSEIAMR